MHLAPVDPHSHFPPFVSSTLSRQRKKRSHHKHWTPPILHLPLTCMSANKHLPLSSLFVSNQDQVPPHLLLHLLHLPHPHLHLPLKWQHESLFMLYTIPISIQSFNTHSRIPISWTLGSPKPQISVSLWILCLCNFTTVFWTSWFLKPSFISPGVLWNGDSTVLHL